jgi:hypothetical protein
MNQSVVSRDDTRDDSVFDQTERGSMIERVPQWKINLQIYLLSIKSLVLSTFINIVCIV